MKILIATDGSVYGDAAIAMVGRSFKEADVKIVSVYEQPVISTAAGAGAVGAAFAVPAVYSPLLDKEFQEMAASAAMRAAKLLEDKFPGAARKITTRVLCGSPSQAVIEQARNWKADLIVTGSHGYGFWKRTLLGSVSNAVLHHAPCSVMIVRQDDDFYNLRN